MESGCRAGAGANLRVHELTNEAETSVDDRLDTSCVCRSCVVRVVKCLSCLVVGVDPVECPSCFDLVMICLLLILW